MKKAFIFILCLAALVAVASTTHAGPDEDAAALLQLAAARQRVLDAAPVDPPHDHGDKLTYVEARDKALRADRPLVVWIGGEFCPECVEMAHDDFIHAFITRREAERIGFRVLADEQVVVSVKYDGDMVMVGTATWWEPGKPAGERHLAHVREALRNWRSRRQETNQYAPAKGWNGGSGIQMQPVMMQQPMMRSMPVMSRRSGGC